MKQGYQICVKGHFDLTWADWFDGLTIYHAENGVTVLMGTVADQAALYGMLNKLSDLGMTLVSVNPVEAGRHPPAATCPIPSLSADDGLPLRPVRPRDW